MSIQINLTAGTPPPGWQDLLDAGEGNRIFHSAAWIEFESYNERLTPLYAIIQQTGTSTPIALAGIVQFTPPIPLFGQWLRHWRLEACPVVLSGDLEFSTRREVVQAIQDTARQNGAVIVSCVSRGGVFGWEEAFQSYECTKSHEFVLTMQPEDQLRKGCTKGRRWNIKKAAKLGITTREMKADEVSSDSALHALTSLERDTSARSQMIGRSQRWPGWDAERYKALARRILRIGQGHLLVAEAPNDDLVAALVLLRSGSTGYLKHAAYSQQGYETGAPSLLWWGTFMFAYQHGIELINFGAVPAGAQSENSSDHGLYQFKKSFGAEPIQWCDWRREIGTFRMRLVRMVRPDAYR